MNQAMKVKKMSNLALTNAWTTYKYVVHVINGLSKHHIVQAHCKFGDQDMGLQHIHALTNAWTTYKYVVHVINGLSKHHIVQAHCKFGDQDMGG
jgi:hypothetical protein